MSLNAEGESHPASGRGSSRRGLKITAGVILGLIGLGGVAYGVDYAVTKNHVPRGVTVAGVPIGGMQKTKAEEKLRTELGNQATLPIKLTAGEIDTQIDPKAAGLTINWDKTMEAVGTPSLNPITKIRSFFQDVDVNVESDVDKQKFDAEIDRVNTEVNRAPVDGEVLLVDGKVSPKNPVNGQTVDRKDIAKNVEKDWLEPAGVKVDAKITEPAITQKVMDPFIEGDAAKAVSAPIIVHGRDKVDGVIPVERMGEVVTFRNDGNQIHTDINVEAARNILAETLGKTEAKKQNAKISFAGGGKSVTPSVDGAHIDWEKTLGDFSGRIVGTLPREEEAIYIDEPATFTTDMAKSATFDEEIGSFTTGGFSGPSGTNIAKTASIVDGAIVAPGDTFSLNGYTGPRGAAQGFVESGIILNGRADKAVGGGISQFATTLYNAAYFAGMEDVAHTAHSYYISRYPAGREATVFEGAIDLQFKNTSKYPVLIKAGVSGDSVSVRLMGVKTVHVESISGGRWNMTQPKEVKVSGKDCSPSSGAPGFTTSDTRVVSDLSGNVISRNTTTTVYDPSPIVVCTG